MPRRQRRQAVQKIPLPLPAELKCLSKMEPIGVPTLSTNHNQRNGDMTAKDFLKAAKIFEKGLRDTKLGANSQPIATSEERRGKISIMKIVKIVAALAIAVGAFSLGACASKPAPVTPAPSFSK